LWPGDGASHQVGWLLGGGLVGSFSGRSSPGIYSRGSHEAASSRGRQRRRQRRRRFAVDDLGSFPALRSPQFRLADLDGADHSRRATVDPPRDVLAGHRHTIAQQRPAAFGITPVRCRTGSLRVAGRSSRSSAGPPGHRPCGLSSPGRVASPVKSRRLRAHAPAAPYPGGHPHPARCLSWSAALLERVGIRREAHSHGNVFFKGVLGEVSSSSRCSRTSGAALIATGRRGRARRCATRTATG
jgi:hypothetical protein